MLSPPGTSPTPVCPALSRRITMLRVKNGPCAPLRFSNMLSRPATGITRSSVTVGVAFAVVETLGFVDMDVVSLSWLGLVWGLLSGAGRVGFDSVFGASAQP